MQRILNSYGYVSSWKWKTQLSFNSKNWINGKNQSRKKWFKTVIKFYSDFKIEVKNYNN